jgi:hypothetical protein
MVRTGSIELGEQDSPYSYQAWRADAMDLGGGGPGVGRTWGSTINCKGWIM